jgi:hypothetical protein
MANAWRDSEAYILVGIEEVSGAPAKLVGVSDHLDDADLQQFVNSKTNRPIQFAYSEVDVDGFTIGVIRIPLQQRPFFLKKQFGPLQPSVVCIRRGSSTDTATPDEIHQMGESSAVSRSAPSLDLQFGDRSRRILLGPTISISRVALDPIDDNQLPIVAANPYLPGRANENYYYEMRDYVRVTRASAAVSFVVRNSSESVALDVRVEFRVSRSDDLLMLHKLPQKPLLQHDLLANISLSPHLAPKRDMTVKKVADDWHIDIYFGKIQPGADAWPRDELFVGTFADMAIVLDGTLFGDNFKPIPVRLEVVSKPTRRAMTLTDLRD